MSRNVWVLVSLVSLVACGGEDALEPDIGEVRVRDMGRSSIIQDMLVVPTDDASVPTIDGTVPVTDGSMSGQDSHPPGASDAGVPLNDVGGALPPDAGPLTPDAGSAELPATQIGAGGSSLIGMPFYGLYDYSQMGAIYLAEELIAEGAEAGAINSIQFQFNGWSNGYSVENQTLKISHVRESTIPDNSGPDYGELTLTNTTVVKQNFTYTNPPSEDWEQFVFDTPFLWDGRSNILISWENRDGTYEQDYGWIEGESALRNRSHRWAQDDSYPESDSSDDSGRPNLKINSPGAPGHIH